MSNITQLSWLEFLPIIYLDNDDLTSTYYEELVAIYVLFLFVYMQQSATFPLEYFLILFTAYYPSLSLYL